MNVLIFYVSVRNFWCCLLCGGKFLGFFLLSYAAKLCVFELFFLLRLKSSLIFRVVFLLREFFCALEFVWTKKCLNWSKQLFVLKKMRIMMLFLFSFWYFDLSFMQCGPKSDLVNSQKFSPFIWNWVLNYSSNFFCLQ